MNLKKQVGSADGTTLHERVAAWLELLDGCGSKPTRKRVHALRVATLRLQAELEHDISELPRASHQAQAMLQFSKQAEKLRQVLGPVREIDVWIGTLRGLRTSLSESGEYVPRSMQECLRGIDRLEDRLHRKRRTAGKKLVASIEKKSDRFVKAAEKLETAPEDFQPSDAAGIANDLIAHFGRVRAEFPELDEANLHEFRKRIKMVRYLAEMHAGADRECARIATQMRKLQSAIGEWHDWQALAEETGHMHHAWSKPLAELFESVSKETFETALETAYSVTARMLGKDAERAEPLRGADRKLPAHSEPGPHMASEEKLA
ncbi:MAG TPA: CHAD domain-containing protein [Terracidiphilus sp.]|nr:CHAD domain-containing protein [Terracidiphilus sp.]